MYFNNCSIKFSTLPTKIFNTDFVFIDDTTNSLALLWTNFVDSVFSVVCWPLSSLLIFFLSSIFIFKPGFLGVTLGQYNLVVNQWLVRGFP